MNMKTSELHASCCLGSHKSSWKIKSEYRITSKSKTVHITIAHHLFVRRNISLWSCVITGIFMLSVYIKLRSLHMICLFTAVDCVRYPSYNQRNQATWTCKAPAQWNLHRMKFHSSQNGWAEYRFIHSNADHGPRCEYKDSHMLPQRLKQNRPIFKF